MYSNQNEDSINKKKMKRKITHVFAIVIISVSLYSCGSKEHSADDGHNHGASERADAHEDMDEILFSADKANAIGLELETIKPDVFKRVIKTSGQVLSAQGDEVTVVAPASGIISFTNTNITDGMAIRSGETLVRISAKNIADGDPVAKAKITYEAARKAYLRSEELVKDKIVSTKEYEQARSQYETAKTAYEVFANKTNANGISVSSPISGYIKNRLVNQGEFVSLGQPIVTVSENKKLQLRAEVPEQYFSELKSITDANFKLSYDNSTYKLADLGGRLLSFGKASSQNSFYVPVTFEFDNIGNIIPGSFSEIYLLSSPREDIISVPQSALTEEQGLYFVYIQLDAEGYKKQEVTLGQDNGDRIQILSGLKEGDKVVTKGTYQVKLAANSSVIPEGHSH